MQTMSITSDMINELYRRFKRQPKRLEDRNLSLLVDYALDTDALDMDGEKLVFTRMEPSSPLREIMLDKIHGVADLPGVTAVVLRNSIIFIDKDDLSTRVHVKQLRRPLSAWFRKNRQ